jgi:membrane glycosyltransferase
VTVRRHLLRIGAVASTALLSAEAAVRFARVFPLDGSGALGTALLVLFTICFAWVALGAMVFAFGLVAAVWRGRDRPPRAAPGVPPEAGARTAVLVPIRHEDPRAVTAQLEVMFTGLRQYPTGRQIDFVLLSDSSLPEVCLAEERAWRELCERQGAFGRIYYRRRVGGEAKKAGNIRDFCLRHAGAYRYLVVLDADSMLAPGTLCAMVERMEANPQVGLLQAPSIPVRRRTLFARWQQFAARVYGPLWTTAEAALAGPDGSYYGHNAILRRDAFCENAGLGALPGRGALSGLVASHDFVEAALVRRAGYEVWIASDLGGSYEQCPTNVVDYAVRDLRWCHGNLQHLRIAVLPGLDPWSRLHLLRGALSYLIPPLTLLFTWVMLAVAARDRSILPDYFPPGKGGLFPLWPVHDFEAGRQLLVLTAMLLLGPKLVATFAALASTLRARELPLRRVPALLTSVVVETVLSALLAPTLMVYQAMFVLRVLLGERSTWGAARRSDRVVGMGEAVRRCWIQLVAAAALAGASWWVSPLALVWCLPVAVPLLLAPLLARLTSSDRVGRIGDALGLFQVPEDWSADPVLTVYDLPASEPGPAAPVDDREWARHALVLVGSGLVREAGKMAEPVRRAG